MLNKASLKQTLVAILLVAASAASADPPGAWRTGAAFQDWRLDCPGAGCTVHTRVAGADGSEVLRVALGSGALPGLAVRTPLGLFLPDGIALAVGPGPALAAPWRTCGRTGCEALLPADAALLAAMKKERTASVTFTLVDGTAVRLPFSLLGLSAALRAREAVSAGR